MIPISAAYDLPETEQIIYGYSGGGRKLEAYRFGNGKNVIVITFVLHGYEDNWDKDGLALVHTAEKVMEHLESSELPDAHDWTVYILPCCNPDGLYSGWTNNGPGRCTTSYITSDGSVSASKGIDMNRCFPTSFVRYSNNRNYTSNTAMACLEARALAAFIQEVKGSKVNVLVDVHGWLQQIITNSSRLRTALTQNFPYSSQSYSAGGTGYLSTYANSLGYEAALLELPAGYYSMNAFLSSSTVQRMINAVDDILKSVPLTCTQNGHDYVIQRNEPTCLEGGQERETCKVCGKTKSKRLPALGHDCNPDSISIVKYPTATQTGLQKYTCARCLDTSLTTVIPSIFSDVNANSYYAAALDWCYGEGYVNGTSVSTFSPGLPLSRAMLVTILYRFHGEPEVEDALVFNDVVEGTYYENAVRWAYSTGITEGTSETTFSPHLPITRQETAAIFHRYVQYLGMDNGINAQTEWLDEDLIKNYARDGIDWAVSNNILRGDGKGYLMPDGETTRGQAVTILWRVADYIENQATLDETEQPQEEA